ncbi:MULTISPECIES: response regulator [unclassified Mesorhizobium]|uniref:response regulator n=1 Tax=unclassified Mesorhizobium TaxID=325217 RepID=UPI00333A5E73
MRIAIVNDMPLAVELLRLLVTSTPGHQVAWIAVKGREAVVACQRDLPDLVLMDLVMPEMDGVEATLRIMAERRRHCDHGKWPASLGAVGVDAK